MIASDSLDVGHGACLLQIDFRVITEHEAQRPRSLPRARELDVAADERVGDAGDADDAAALEHDRVVELGVDDLAVARRST